MRPYYDEGGITIYHGDCRGVLPALAADVLVTDPPYGMDYRSAIGVSDARPFGESSIAGDKDTTARDAVLLFWGDRPALVFGHWRIPRPPATRALLIWDRGSWGMGDLSLPWRPTIEEIYVMGHGFVGQRGSPILAYSARKAGGNTRERTHPMEKPVGLMRVLLLACPREWTICDPFMGSGSTLRAAKDLGRRAIGIEIEERYCEIAARRLSQMVLPLEAGA